MMADRRRLFVDIETSPLIVTVWSLHDPANANISHHNIVRDRGIIVIGYKWEGEKKVSALTWDCRQSDKAMLEEFIPILSSAHEVCAHNGNRFDIPWIRGRCLVHGVPMSPTLPTIDTLQQARSKLRLPSNRLDYLGDTLIGEGKIKTDFSLWRDIVLEKSDTAMEKMVRYCKQDVRLLEQVFDRMRPYMDSKTSIAEKSRDCPECGSSHTRLHDRRKSAAGIVKVQFRCVECGVFHTVSEKNYETNKPLSVG